MIDKYMLQFFLTKGIGEVAIKKAISFIENRDCSWYDLICNDTLQNELNLREQIKHNLCLESKQAEFLYNELVENGVVAILENDEKYPRYLKEMLGEKCPAVLFVSGNINLLNTISVGFCGSRRTSKKGLEIAASCARQLAEKDVTVISGYAKGTDISVHKASLQSGGKTIFVLAEGILRYRKKNEIREYLNHNNYLYVSQFMPDIIWSSGNAMRRNSVIIGLSRAMILVESGTSGGTFSAGQEALRVKCPLFVVDFAQPEVSAEANPYFIGAGGKAIRGKNGIPNISRILSTIVADERTKIREDIKNNYQLEIGI